MTITTALLSMLVISCIGSWWLLWSLWSRYNERMQEALDVLKKTKENERKLQRNIESLKTKVHQTTEDPITRLPSWQLFEDRLQQGVKESARYHLVLGVLIVKLEGIPMMDASVVQEAALRLKRSIRVVDSLCRQDKETFIIMATRLGKPETAAIAAQRVLQALMQPFEIDHKSVRLTAGIGIATYPQDGQSSAELLVAAEHALHAASAKGLHRYEFFQPTMSSNSRRMLLISAGLNSDETINQFVIRFQPIVNTLKEEIICMDAQLSWEQEELGNVDMDELFEHAEKQQKLNKISECMLQSACKKFVHWRSLGFRPALLGVTLPITMLLNSTFVCKLPQIMKNAHFDPAWLLIQIKSENKQVSFDVLEKSFNMLRYLGIQLAIDNFGASSLSMLQLKQFPVNYFKLDKALIKGMETNPQTAIIIQSSLELAQNLGAQLIITGVESTEQMKLLKETGCVLMEGKALGLPLTEEEVVTKANA